METQCKQKILNDAIHYQLNPPRTQRNIQILRLLRIRPKTAPVRQNPTTQTLVKVKHRKKTRDTNILVSIARSDFAGSRIGKHTRGFIQACAPLSATSATALSHVVMDCRLIWSSTAAKNRTNVQLARSFSRESQCWRDIS
jgi:hypothetical protein